MHSLKIGKLKNIHFKGIRGISLKKSHDKDKLENKPNKPKRKIKKRFIVLGVIVLIILSFTAKSLLAPKPLPKVSCTPLSKGNVKSSISVTGDIESNDSYDVYAELNNVIKEVKVEKGDEVKKGDVLAVLDSEALEKDIELAKEEAGTTKSSNQIKADTALDKYKSAQSSDDDIRNAEESINSAQNNVDSKKKIYDKNKVLYDAGAVSESTLDEKEKDYNDALSELTKAENSLSQAKNKYKDSINDAKSAYESAKNDADDRSKDISIEKQELQLEKCIIKAPADGTVTTVNAKEGNPAGGALFTIQDLSSKKIKATIKEVDIAKVKVGQDVEIKTDATDDDITKGRVISIDKAAPKGSSMAGMMKNSSGNGQEGSSGAAASTESSSSGFSAEISIDEDNENLLSGMSARLNIITDEKDDVLTVSADSVVDDDEGKCIYTVQKNENGKYEVKRVSIDAGTESDFDTEISGDELQEGMLIINDPSNVKPGDIVQVSKE